MELLQKLALTLGVDGTVGIQWLFFIATVVVLYVFLFKPAIAYLDAREEKMADDGDELDGRRRDLENMIADYDAKIKKALIGAGDVRTATRKTAAEEEEKLLGEARGKAGEIVDGMREEIGKTEKIVREELKAESESIADMIIDQLLA